MHSLDDNKTFVNLLPAKRNAGATQITGTAVDTNGDARKLLVLASVGEVTANTITVTIQESSDNSTFTTLYALTAMAAAGTQVIDLTPAKRYVRAYADISNTSSVGTISYSVWGIFYNERNRPSLVVGF